ncbi:MAG TPA: hypothetical protein VK893_04870 [Pyrinomonadaceae bacterium]|nr:hypothetical protein [Pyrinomonadaceae bacterium]
MKRRTLLSLAILGLLIGTTAFYPPTNAHVQTDPFAGRTITGTAYFIGGRRPGRSLPFRLIINRFSTSEEVSQLNSALQSGGEDELLRALSRMDVGRIEVGAGVGVPANAIMRTDDGEGRTKLTVLYQRELRFSELRYGVRRADYRFGYAEQNVGRGENEGMLIPAARVRLRDSNTWEVEDFGTFPARLMGLQVRGGGRRTVG